MTSSVRSVNSKGKGNGVGRLGTEVAKEKDGAAPGFICTVPGIDSIVTAYGSKPLALLPVLVGLPIVVSDDPDIAPKNDLARILHKKTIGDGIADVLPIL